MSPVQTPGEEAYGAQKKIDSLRDTFVPLENDVPFVEKNIENFAGKIEILEEKIEKAGENPLAERSDPFFEPHDPKCVRSDIDAAPEQMPAVASNIVVRAPDMPSAETSIEPSVSRIDSQPDTFERAGAEPHWKDERTMAKGRGEVCDHYPEDRDVICLDLEKLFAVLSFPSEGEGTAMPCLLPLGVGEARVAWLLPLQGGEEARLRTTSSRVDERPEGRTGWDGDGAAATA